MFGRRNHNDESRPGLGIDRDGNSVVDPTKNVLQLVEAAVARMDDLREADAQMSVLRAQYDREIAAAEHRRIDEQAVLRATYDEQLREAESKRIDAIRLVDVNAVNVAANRASEQATVLATQVATTAETLRTLVATSATALAAAQGQIIEPIISRLALIERAQYERVGNAQVSDPMMAELVSEVKAQRAILAAGAGATTQRAETKDDTKLLLAIIGAGLTIAGAVIGFR